MALSDLAGNPTNLYAGLGQYEFDHYSGSQIQVMIGDTLVDNAVSLQYQVQQSKTPVYGYASQYFRFVASGPILVVGSLTVAFKEAGYLMYTLQRFHNNKGGNVRYSESDGKWMVNGSSYSDLASASGAAHYGKVRYQNIEQHMMDFVKRGIDANNIDYATLVKQLHALSDNEFEDLAEQYEDAIWYGSGRDSMNTRAALFSRNISDEQSDISEDDVLSHRRVDQYPSVDIWITYGDMEAPDGVNHTVHKLLDVYFTGESQVITASGEPTYETYNFLCRNKV